MEEQPACSREMPRYQCHKQVWALKIAAIEIHEDKSATIAPADAGYASFKTEPGWAERFRGDESDPGVYVVYADGFKSWSPSKAFDAGYAPIVADDRAAYLGAREDLLTWKGRAQRAEARLAQLGEKGWQA